ncbi:hypothetical protein BHE74_00021268 [Ensete ventricosum]|nr:hypothetical protein BHE74_00021268 [Ensete ventricosum]
MLAAGLVQKNRPLAALPSSRFISVRREAPTIPNAHRERRQQLRHASEPRVSLRCRHGRVGRGSPPIRDRRRGGHARERIPSAQAEAPQDPLIDHLHQVFNPILFLLRLYSLFDQFLIFSPLQKAGATEEACGLDSARGASSRRRRRRRRRTNRWYGFVSLLLGRLSADWRVLFPTEYGSLNRSWRNARSCTINTVLWNTVQLLFPEEVEARKSSSAVAATPPGGKTQSSSSEQNNSNTNISSRSIRRSAAQASSQVTERDTRSFRRRIGPSQSEDAAMALRLQREEFRVAFQGSREQQLRALRYARANLRAAASMTVHGRLRGRTT